MGCHNSKVCGQLSRKKKKREAKDGQKQIKEIKPQGGGGSPDKDNSDLEIQLKEYSWQMKILNAILATSGDQERDQLLKDHHGDLCTLVHGIIEKVKNEVTSDLTDIHENLTKSALEEHQSETEELQRRYREEKKDLNDLHVSAENALKDQIKGLASELKQFSELKCRAEASTLSRDLQRNIQTHGGPGGFWEQELQSLLFVIEMKHERLKEQGSKLIQMETLVEKNLSLEDQLLHVLQQNEDYRVRLDNYQSLIQQLSAEQHDLQGVLEKRSLQCQKLSQEKEELLFKLLHRRDSCSSFHITSVIPTKVSPS